MRRSPLNVVRPDGHGNASHVAIAASVPLVATEGSATEGASSQGNVELLSFGLARHVAAGSGPGNEPELALTFPMVASKDATHAKTARIRDAV